MRRVLDWIVVGWRELIGLIVDDGFLAIAALAAIGITYLLTRDSALGPVDTAGWSLIAMIAVSTVVSARRAVAAYNRKPN